MRGTGDTLQSVARALGLLEAIASAPAASARQLADQQGLRMATTYHLLKTLLVQDFVIKDGRGYRLGPRIGVLAQALERDLQPDPRSLSVMRRLVERIGDTVYLSRWQQGDVVISAVAEGRHPVRVSGVHVGLRGHAYARASGKVLLAFGPPDRLPAYLDGAVLERLTPSTRSELGEIKKAIERVRQDGYAIDEEEFTAGVCCVAIPIRHGASRETDTALTVSMPTERFRTTRDDVVAELRRAAEEIRDAVPDGRRGDAHDRLATQGTARLDGG